MVSDYFINVGHALEVTRGLAAESVQCVVTSPPYYGLRDYKTGPLTWGGSEFCAHDFADLGRSRSKPDRSTVGKADNGSGVFGGVRGAQASKAARGEVLSLGGQCQACGAWRGHLGLEPTPDLYVEHIVQIFREVRRALRPDGTLWLNLGDSYANDTKWGGASGGKCAKGLHGQTGIGRQRRETGLKSKELIGIPWMVAFALRADGWYLRQDIIWAKGTSGATREGNSMPESVRDRCSKSHEYLFLLSKSPRYYFDADAIKEPKATATLKDPRTNGNGRRRDRGFTGLASNGGTNLGGRPQYARALEIARERGLTDEHLAAVRAAGLTDAGKNKATQTGTGRNEPRVQQLAAEAKAALGGYYREFLTGEMANRRSVWRVNPVPYKGAHFAVFPEKLVEPCVLAGSRAGDLVYDPFCGAGTVGKVATKLGRRFVGAELNPEYAEMARRRIGENVKAEEAA